MTAVRLLYVDDSPMSLRIVDELSAQWGATVRTTTQPAEALEWIRRGDPFDVALLDMRMPDMDGLALAQEIRKHRSAEALPLILLTALGQIGDDVRSAFAVTLTKPIKPSALFNGLLTVLGRDTVRSPGPGPAPASQFDTTLGERLPMRILLAEDNVVNQRVAVQILKRFGYRTDVVGNGLEAIDALRRQTYDLILMDVHMPEMDGLEATRRICAEWPKDEKPRIVAMTANVLPEEVQECSAVGMDGFVAKPVSIDALRLVLEQSAGRRQQPASPGPESGVTIDQDVIDGLFELATEEEENFVTEIIDSFVADTPGVLASMKECVVKNEADQLHRLSHTLKGSSGVLGAVSMTSLCSDLEARGRNGSIDGAAELVARLEVEFGRAASILQARKNQR